jgi:hypothetical protein
MMSESQQMRISLPIDAEPDGDVGDSGWRSRLTPTSSGSRLSDCDELFDDSRPSDWHSETGNSI